MTVAQAVRERDKRLWTADQFLDFYMKRPDGERWQLVDGLAMMMVPPSFTHQRIADNFQSLLKVAVKANRPELFAFENVGLRIQGIEDFNPQPDVAVCPAGLSEEHYTDQFFLVAEVISPSNTAEMIERKLELYRSHPGNLYCLAIHQDSVQVVLYSRDGEDWRQANLRSLDDTLVLTAFGFKATLAQIYEGTPLAR